MHTKNACPQLARILRYNSRTCHVARLPKDRNSGQRGTWITPTNPRGYTMKKQQGFTPVSYTHLDVYKRQHPDPFHFLRSQ